MIRSKLKERMSDAGMTIQVLADKTGLSTNTITRARGDLIGRCTLDTLATIAEALACRVKDLFEEE